MLSHQLRHFHVRITVVQQSMVEFFHFHTVFKENPVVVFESLDFQLYYLVVSVVFVAASRDFQLGIGLSHLLNLDFCRLS